MTVTLAAPKIPLVFPPADTHAGDLVIADIGIPLPLLDELEGPHLELLTRERMREIVPARARRFAQGRLRPRAGRRRIARPDRRRAPRRDRRAAIGRRPGDDRHAAVVPADRRRDGAGVHDRAARRDGRRAPSTSARSSACSSINADVIAVGPGLGQSPGTAAFVQALLERTGVPLVLDADALNAFAGEPDRLMGRDGVGVVITPHPGEMARLLNTSIEAVQHDRLRHAREFAAAHRVHVVLKGHRTVIAAPDGRTFVNLTGNAGMATGGTGDLLTGMIAAWFAQLLDAEAACKLAVYLHGTAGDLAEADEGEVALVAGDIAARLGDAVLELTARRQVKRES